MSILIYLATIFWSLFPNLIHVFQGGDDLINKVNETNLVVNSDLSLDTNNDNTPDGFSYYNIMEASLNDGVATITASAQFGLIESSLILSSDYIGDKLYLFSMFKSDSNNVRLTFGQGITAQHSGDNNYNLISMINDITLSGKRYQISDYRASGFTPVSIDYIGAYNVSIMINNGVKNDDGILFSDLTDQDIKVQLDTWIAEHGDLSFTITKDNTHDSWFNTGFVDKESERDFLDYLGYFVWLMTPPIMLFITLDLIRRLL